MAITVVESNKYKYELGLGAVNLNTDVFKGILMSAGFVFDPDSDDTLADVTASQLATGNGYTQDDKTLVHVSYVRDDVNDKAILTFVDPSWQASGGSIGPFDSMIIYDDTHASDIVVANADFGGSVTILDGLTFKAEDIAISNL